MTSIVQRSTRWAAFAVSALLVTAAVVATAVPADAAFQSSLTLNQSTSAASATNPKLGQTVTFTAVLAKSVKNPVLIVDCFQNQSLVWEQRGLPTDSFLLGGTSSSWLTSGGPASCVANVYDVVYKSGTWWYMAQAVTQFAADGT